MEVAATRLQTLSKQATVPTSLVKWPSATNVNPYADTHADAYADIFVHDANAHGDRYAHPRIWRNRVWWRLDDRE